MELAHTIVSYTTFTNGVMKRELSKKHHYNIVIGCEKIMSENVYLYGTGKHKEDYISFGAEKKELLNNYDKYESYVKGCEIAVRQDDRYKAYISKLKSAGLTKCAILGNIEEDSKVKLEMHHGPIFNLFDICDIVLRATLKRGKIDMLTTYDIGDLVLKEHEKDNIMIVMLTKTAHKGGHNKNGMRSLFVDIHATFGRIDRFIDRYSDGMIDEHWYYVEQYLKECENAKGTIDNGLFDTAKKLKSFK